MSKIEDYVLKTMAEKNLPEFMPIAQAVKVTGLSKCYLRNLANSKKLDVKRIGTGKQAKIYFGTFELLCFLNGGQDDKGC